MPSRYAGTGDFDNYLVLFDATTKIHKWSDEKKGVILLNRLELSTLVVPTVTNKSGEAVEKSPP